MIVLRSVFPRYDVLGFPHTPLHRPVYEEFQANRFLFTAYYQIPQLSHVLRSRRLLNVLKTWVLDGIAVPRPI